MRRCLLFLFLLVVAACERDDDRFGLDRNNCTPRDIINVSPDSLEKLGTAPYQLDSVSINGDVLICDFRYAGGCGDIQMELFTNGLEDSSIPPGIRIRLALTDEDDCEAWLSSRACFDLKSMKFLSSSDSYILYLDGWYGGIEWRPN